MPSKLPVIKANTTQDNILKMGVIARAHKRSVSKELEFLIENHIAQYEQEHGRIKILEHMGLTGDTNSLPHERRTENLGL